MFRCLFHVIYTMGFRRHGSVWSVAGFWPFPLIRLGILFELCRDKRPDAVVTRHVAALKPVTMVLGRLIHGAEGAVVGLQCYDP